MVIVILKIERSEKLILNRLFDSMVDIGTVRVAGVGVPDVAVRNAVEARPGSSGPRQARGHRLHFQQTPLRPGLPNCLHGCPLPLLDFYFNQT